MKHITSLLCTLFFMCHYGLFAQEYAQRKSESNTIAMTVQTGYQLPVSFLDRRGGTIGFGFVFMNRAIYKLNHVYLTEQSNMEHSLDIILSGEPKRSSLSLGCSYYWSSSSRDIVPAVTFNQFNFVRSNLGFTIRFGLSLYAIGAGVPLASPIIQGNLTYTLFKK